MDVYTTIADLRRRLDRDRCAGRTVGVMPSMGALHAGHAANLERAAQECDVAVLTIFVNPLQFGPNEDLAAYPRTPADDLALAEGAGASVVFAPRVEEMYPREVLTTVAVPALAAVMEGASRPTHFSGVATVVAKLLNIVGPCRGYFGEKDYQQLAIIRAMVDDLSCPVEVVGCPTVREGDGLAMSSRNRYLTPAERAAAPVLYRALQAGAAAVRGDVGPPVTDPARVRGLMTEIIGSEPLGTLDYVEVADKVTLAPVEACSPEVVRLFGAVRFGRARLIDNVGAIVEVGS